MPIHLFDKNILLLSTICSQIRRLKQVTTVNCTLGMCSSKRKYDTRLK